MPSSVEREGAPVGDKATGAYEVFIAKTDSQLEEVFRFRYQIFTKEQNKYLKTADHRREMLVDKLDSSAVHVCVAKDGKIIGSLRQGRGRQFANEAMRKNFSLDQFSEFPDTSFAFTGRLFVLPEHRGSSALLRLLLSIYESGRAAGVVFDFIFCNPHLVRFYEQLGYRRYRSYYEDAELGFQIPLVLVADDADHLGRIRSPFGASSTRWRGQFDHGSWFRSSFPGYQAFVSPVVMATDDFAALLSTKINDNEFAVLNSFSEEEKQDLVQSTTHLKIESGTRIVRRGDRGLELYVILEGVVEVRHPTPAAGAGILLSTLGRGDIFGEMSVITSRVRSAEVVAVTDVEVIFIDQFTLKRLMAGKPAIATKLLYNLNRILVERLETTTARFVEMSAMAAA